MILESYKLGPIKNHRWFVKCEICGFERWVTDGAQPEKKPTHHCKSCASRITGKSKDRQAKQRQTLLEKYGCINAFQSPQTLKTVRARYGVDNVFQAESVKERIKATNLEVHGVEYPSQSVEIRAKSEKTWMKTLGAKRPLCSEAVKSRIDFVAAAQKRHENAKLSGAYGSGVSKHELRFLSELNELFGPENVEHQCLINNQRIDFLLTHHNVYIQFDGVYWHGLMKPIEKLEQETAPRSKAIVDKYYCDRRQDKWFADNNLTLIRITDEEHRKGKHLDKLKAYLDS